MQEELEKQNLAIPEKLQKKNHKAVIILLIVLILLAVIAVYFFVFRQKLKTTVPSTSKLNEINFNFNVDKVKAYNWNNLITEDKISKVLGYSLKPPKGVSAASPISKYEFLDFMFEKDYINFPKSGCISLFAPEDVLVENLTPPDIKSMRIWVGFCPSKDASNVLFENKKEESINEEKINEYVTKINFIENTENIGDKNFYYGYKRTIDNSTTTESMFYFIRNNFAVAIMDLYYNGPEEIFSKEDKTKIAKYLDDELKNISVN